MTSVTPDPNAQEPDAPASDKQGLSWRPFRTLEGPRGSSCLRAGELGFMPNGPIEVCRDLICGPPEEERDAYAHLREQLKGEGKPCDGELDDAADLGSPIILDLDGNGVDAGGVALFDHAGDGFVELSHFVGGADGMLALDRNGNGIIDDGTELFGNNSVLRNGARAAHGFAVLSELDSNSDGQVDASDAGYEELRVLRLVDAPGGAGGKVAKLVTLAEAGVESLGTSFDPSNHVDQYGNEHRQVGGFTRTGGTAGVMTDVWLQRVESFTGYSRAGIPEHSTDISALPELHASGHVYNLRDAMALDEAGRLAPPFYAGERTETRSLRELVQAFGSEQAAAGREVLLERILHRWAGAEGVAVRDYWDRDTSDTLPHPERFAVVEAFYGRQWRAGESERNPSFETAAKIEGSYARIRERVFADLMAQTHLSAVLGEVVATKDSATGVVTYDLSGAVAALRADPSLRTEDFLRALWGWTRGDEGLQQQLDAGLPAEFRLAWHKLTGEVLTGGVGRDWLHGRDGVADVFDSDAGGSDVLRGKGGEDTYWLGSGTGHDTIEEAYGNADGGGKDVIRLKAGIGAKQVGLERSTDDLYVQVLDGAGAVTDSLRVMGYYADSRARIEEVQLSDGSKLYDADDFALARIRGGPNRDFLDGRNGEAEVFDSDAGGGDALRGRGGGDTYWLGSGTGHDTIEEFHGNADGGGKDVIRLKEGIGAGQVDLARDSNDLYVRLLDGTGAVTDSMRVLYHYKGGSARIEEVQLSDGSKLYDADDFAVAWIRGGVVWTHLLGRDGEADVFDSDSGSEDWLYGKGGGDTYWLGSGTGRDTIDEAYKNTQGDGTDVIRIKAGIGADQVDLQRNWRDLYVRLLDSRGEVMDWLRVKDYYVDSKAQIEEVRLADGSLLYGADDFVLAWIHGNEYLYGRDGEADVFDNDADLNNVLRGKGGGDTYWLGAGTGHDTIEEAYGNAQGGGTDVIRLKAGIGAEQVGLARSVSDLLVQVLDGSGAVTDSLRVKNYYADSKARIEEVQLSDGSLLYGAEAFSLARVHGRRGNDTLYGRDGVADVFDSDAGGDDVLRGKGGGDTYWLGAGTGHDTIDERYLNWLGGGTDVVLLKAGIVAEQVALARTAKDLYVRLLDSSGAATDSLRVRDYYVDSKAWIEEVKLADGSLLYGAEDFALARIRGGISNEDLHGRNEMADIFDSDAGGSDVLRGRGGGDTYWLGAGTGHDTIEEGYFNQEGDGTDIVRLKAGIGASQVGLERIANDLYVQLLDGTTGAVTDSLRVLNHYADSKVRIEEVQLSDGSKLHGAEAFALARIRGGHNRDYLYGRNGEAEVFDSDAGGNDRLHGRGGGDTYWLGKGTGHDEIFEAYDNVQGDGKDVIRLKEGIGKDQVGLARTANDLYVQLLDGTGAVTDSLRVKDYYVDSKARIEEVQLSDRDKLYSADDFAGVLIQGGPRNDHLEGSDVAADMFDSNKGGNDVLRGKGGGDTYWLGAGTGHDTIEEAYYNAQGDGKDVVRLKEGIGAGQVGLARTANDLYVQVLDGSGAVTDSLRVLYYYADGNARIEEVQLSDGSKLHGAEAFALARIRGGTGDDHLYGRDGEAEVFDSDAGGSDVLRGRGGGDTYWLGWGTGQDTIEEAYGNAQGGGTDVIRIKEGIGAEQVELARTATDLHVRLLDSSGAVTDWLWVLNHYADSKARIEEVQLEDGSKLYDAEAFALARFRGVPGDDHLEGREGEADVFDSDAGGNDELRGKGGGDTYWLGAGTGHDTINEAYDNTQGDGTDVIRLKEGIGAGQVELKRTANDLHVRLLDKTTGEVTDWLRVLNHYVGGKAQIEEVRFADGSLLHGPEAFALDRIRGGPGDDSLSGRNGEEDVFDSDLGGNDRLHGLGGGDTYWLGKGTGNDDIFEKYGNPEADGKDVVRLKTGIGAEQVRLERTLDDLYVQVLDSEGAVTDRLRVRHHYLYSAAQIEEVQLSDESKLYDAEDFALAPIRGGPGDDSLLGRNGEAEVFDTDAGGYDRLHGRGGGDTYRLGKGTGHDDIFEAYGNPDADGTDVIWIKAGIGASQVGLERTLDDLQVQVLDGEGAVTDSLWVKNYYADSKARIEEVQLSDGSLLYDADDFALARIRGSVDDDSLVGRNGESEVFDSDAGGNDRLHGRGGGDTYWLGKGTGHDDIFEAFDNPEADGNDMVRLKEGIGVSDLRIERLGNDVRIELLGALGTDGVRAVDASLRVSNYYGAEAAQVEGIGFADGKEWLGKLVLGTALDEKLTGSSADEIYWGGGGTDTYRFDRGFGKDVVAGDGGSGQAEFAGLGLDELSFAAEGTDLLVASGSDLVRLEEWWLAGDSRGVKAAGHELDMGRLAELLAGFDGSGAGNGPSFAVAPEDYWMPVTS